MTFSSQEQSKLKGFPNGKEQKKEKLNGMTKVISQILNLIHRDCKSYLNSYVESTINEIINLCYFIFIFNQGNNE